MTSETETDEVVDEAAQNSNPADQSLDQIREILFGTQTRNIDERLQGLHDQVFDAIGSLRALITERADSLNGKLEREMRILHDELNEYRREHHERADELDSKFTNTTNDLRQQVGALRENLAGTEKTVRADMEQGFETLKQNFASQMNQVREQLQQDMSQLSNSKVSRRTLSDVLRQLSAEFADD